MDVCEWCLFTCHPKELWSTTAETAFICTQCSHSFHGWTNAELLGLADKRNCAFKALPLEKHCATDTPCGSIWQAFQDYGKIISYNHSNLFIVTLDLARSPPVFWGHYYYICQDLSDDILNIIISILGPSCIRSAERYLIRCFHAMPRFIRLRHTDPPGK